MSLIENAGFLHFCRRLRVSCLALAGLFELGTIGPVLAADIVGSADHPLVSRYSGSTIYAYETKAYDAYYGILGPSDGKGGFEDMALHDAGFLAHFDVKDLALIESGNGKSRILVANNDRKMQVFEFRGQADKPQFAER